jgi:quercetin dioxygenase-like cupin family protein
LRGGHRQRQRLKHETKRSLLPLKAGDVLFIPYGTIHAVKNVGTGNASELATYIVEKGRPLVVSAK